MKSNNPEFIKKRFLEKLPIFAAADYFDTDHIEIDVEYDYMRHAMLAKMCFSAWAEKLPVLYQPISESASWWQKFKDDLCPDWFKKRFPVKRITRKLEINISALYPDFKPAVDGKIAFMIDKVELKPRKSPKIAKSTGVK